MKTPVSVILQRIETPGPPEEPRKYLGASQIGHPCARALWYEFRHCGREVFSARMLRLFDRGHREEEVFYRLLRKAGMEVWEIDPDTGEQFAISDFNGHFRGHTDGIGKFPGDDAVGLELKSYNLKRFTVLTKMGVKLESPKYYSQMQVYMEGMKLKTTLFCAVCKDNDELHMEYVEFDPLAFQSLNNKAHSILNADSPPMRIGTPETYECRHCPHLGICHHSQKPLKNCRSCKFGEPAENSTWICSKGHEFGEVCGDYKAITEQ